MYCLCQTVRNPEFAHDFLCYGFFRSIDTEVHRIICMFTRSDPTAFAGEICGCWKSRNPPCSSIARGHQKTTEQMC